MRVAMDEQIFAVQRFGGISRLFATLAKQYDDSPGIDVDLDAMNAPVINQYLLEDPELSRRLRVRPVRTEFGAIARYLVRPPRRSSVEVAHSTFYLPHGLADHPGVPKVMTIHDMIPELMPKTRRRLDFITLKRRYVEKVDHIICVSEATHQDLVRLYGTPDAPVTVVHHGVDSRFHPAAPRLAGAPERYVLFVGHRGSYKDAVTLVRAFTRVAQEDPDLQLLFVGGGAFTSREVELLNDAGLGGRSRQMQLADTDMPSAYANALLCVFPSRYEGFGLPALEAMACGTPLVLADASSLPEVGGDAARYFAPGDGADLFDVMVDVLGDVAQQERMAAKGLARAAEFTWNRTAAQTAAVYRSVLAHR